MALLWFDGFDNYGSVAGSLHSPSRCMERRYMPCYDPFRSDTPRIPNNGFSLQGSYTGTFITPSLTTDPTLIVGFAYRQYNGDIATGVSATLMGLYNGATRGIYLYLTARTGELSVYRDGGTAVLLGTTSGARIANHRWNYVELKVYCHDAAGAVEVRVNGKTKLSLTNVDTKRDTLAYYDRAGMASLGPNYGPLYDDFYVCDGTGGSANDFLGPVKVVALRPSADVAGAKDWTPQSGGDHYAMVDENPANDNTDYIETGASGNTDLFEYADSPADIGTIRGLNICTECAETDAQPFSIKMPAKLTTQSDGEAREIGGTGFRTLVRLMAADPEGAGWTKSNLDSTQFGVKLA